MHYKPMISQRSANGLTIQPVAITSEAQRLLLEHRVTLGQLAAACRVSRQTCSRWMRGVAPPSPKYRPLIQAAFPACRKDLWDVQPRADYNPAAHPELDAEGDPADAGADGPPEGETDEVEAVDLEGPGAARKAAAAHLKRIAHQRQRAERKGFGPELKQLYELERRAIKDLAQFTGELSTADESRLTESARWQQIRRAIIAAVVKHPQAAKDVAKALQEVGA